MDARRCEMNVESCGFMEFVYVLEKRWAANLSHAVMVEICSYTVVALRCISLDSSKEEEKEKRKKK